MVIWCESRIFSRDSADDAHWSTQQPITGEKRRSLGMRKTDNDAQSCKCNFFREFSGKRYIIEVRNVRPDRNQSPLSFPFSHLHLMYVYMFMYTY